MTPDEIAAEAAIGAAIAQLDVHLSKMRDRQLVSTIEVEDMLLDIRNWLTSIPLTER
jgi:hypothetical protein